MSDPRETMLANMAKENWMCNTCAGKGWMDCNLGAKEPGDMCDNCAEFCVQKDPTKIPKCVPSAPAMWTTLSKSIKSNNGHGNLKYIKPRQRNAHPAIPADRTPGPGQADQAPTWPEDIIKDPIGALNKRLRIATHPMHRTPEQLQQAQQQQQDPQTQGSYPFPAQRYEYQQSGPYGSQQSGGYGHLQPGASRSQQPGGFQQPQAAPPPPRLYQHPEHPQLYSLWPLSPGQLPTRFQEMPSQMPVQQAPQHFAGYHEVSSYPAPNGAVMRLHTMRNAAGQVSDQHTETLPAHTTFGASQTQGRQNPSEMPGFTLKMNSSVNAQDIREGGFAPWHVSGLQTRAQPAGVSAAGKRKANDQAAGDTGAVKKIAGPGKDD